MDQRTAFNFLMSNVKHRYMVEKNFERCFPSNKYYKSHNQNIGYAKVDMDKVVRDDAVLNIKKFIYERKMTIPDVIHYAQISNNFQLFNDYKDFIGVYGLTIHNQPLETQKIYLGINTGIMQEYARSKYKDPNYDSSFMILRVLIYNMEEKLLVSGNRSGNIDEYTDLLVDFSYGYDDVLKIILDNIYISTHEISIIADNNNLPFTKYAIEKYLQNGGLLSDINDDDLFIGVINDVPTIEYIPVFKYLLSIQGIPHNFQELYDKILNNERLQADENLRHELLQEVEKYIMQL
ncbi:Hypothetical protein ORPV_265 [Orpheovirus IHUMI-LCC2]|uniref:Uncharacterized protein n=1 Tax=Orpheovirus IHUMI-LCC2 TaxID=2023057 RepID=A0A2I2L3Y1_9VIRU|nr:Hypothetical protein ORPV_265 [Orpheovirus IHUMI-LCC2]SNW62169.1 Hypothetical protein ORPV_265 [Orpheovirus IHUMI-LCC2]